MRSALRNTAILSGSSITTIVLGLASSKVFALLLGPSGVGFVGLLQSLLSVGVMVAAMGVGVGFVRGVAMARSQADDITESSYRLAIVWLRLGLSLLTIVVFILLRHRLSVWLFE